MTTPDNGYVLGNMVSVGSNVILGCDTGVTRLCQVDGTHDTQSQCQSNDTHASWTIDSMKCVQGTTYVGVWRCTFR